MGGRGECLRDPVILSPSHSMPVLLEFRRMRVLAGTSGYSYKEWKGSFYPEDLPAGEMLRYYAERFAAVEINNTFYRMPKSDVLARWAEQVPDGFRFALKASQQITHRKRLKDAADPVAYFFKVAVTLGDRMGPVLCQLPPNLEKDLARVSDIIPLPPTSTLFPYTSLFRSTTAGRGAGRRRRW